MDEDQFYFGETLSGQTGLVPSNYVERIPDYVLLQNASRAPSPSACALASGYNQWGGTESVGNLNSGLPGSGCCSASGSLPRNTPLGTQSRACCRIVSCSSQPYCSGAGGVGGGGMGAGGNVSGLKSLVEMPQNSSHTVSPQPNPVQTVTDAMLANGVALPGAPTRTNVSSRPASPSFTLSVPPHHAQITHDFTELDNENVPLPDSVCPYPPVDVSKVTVQEIRNPKKLRGRFLWVACGM